MYTTDNSKESTKYSILTLFKLLVFIVLFFFQIVEIKDDSVLKLRLEIYKNATANENYSDVSCVDAAVNVQLGCIRVVFLMRFISDILVIYVMK